MAQNPYQAPPVPMEAPKTGDSYSFRPLKTLALAITIFMSIFVAAVISVSVVDTIAGSMYPNFTNPAAEVSDQTELNFVYISFGFAIVSGLAHIVLIVLVCTFLYRANANLRTHGHELEYTPGWCGGWWFVPIMNLFKPYYCTKEIYITSHASATAEDAKLSPLSQDSGTSLLTFWWALWLITTFIGRIESRLAIRGTDIGEMALPLNWASTVTSAGAGILLVFIVCRIKRWQS